MKKFDIKVTLLITVSSAIILFSSFSIAEKPIYTHCPHPDRVAKSATLLRHNDDRYVWWSLEVNKVSYSGTKSLSPKVSFQKGRKIGGLKKVILYGQAVACVYENGGLTNYGSISLPSYFIYNGKKSCKPEHRRVCYPIEGIKNPCKFVFFCD